jgi:hypothetical protein
MLSGVPRSALVCGPIWCFSRDNVQSMNLRDILFGSHSPLEESSNEATNKAQKNTSVNGE